MNAPRPFVIHFLAVAIIVAAATTCAIEHAAAAGNDRSPSAIDAGHLLPADRMTQWQPGLTGAGGIPARSTICATINPGNGAADDTARIQAAINVCPAGEVVQLSAGTFLVNDGHYLRLNKGITLRGAGPGKTILAKTNGAKPFQSDGQRKTFTADRGRRGAVFRKRG